MAGMVMRFITYFSSNPLTPPPVLSFNVGGNFPHIEVSNESGLNLFSTTQSALESYPVLARMVLGDCTRDATRAPFVDCDPELFRHVLFFLRRGRLPAAVASSRHTLLVRTWGWGTCYVCLMAFPLPHFALALVSI
jgi:hypothetical protein